MNLERRRRQRITTVFVLLFAMIGSRRAPAAEPELTDVFVAGKGGYHTYRIPSLLVTPKGAVLIFCEGRRDSRSDDGNNDLLLRRSTNSGRSWHPVQLVYEEGGESETTIGNPCPVADRNTGTIWLFMTRDNDAALLTKSRDEGVTWSKPLNVTEQIKKDAWGWYATGPGVGIQLTRGKYQGRLVIPCDHRETKNRSGPSFSHMIYSDDHGETWQLGESVGPHTNECQVAELADGRLIVNCRNHWGRSGKRPDLAGRRVIAFSSDGGHSWSQPQFDDVLIEPQCQASLISVSDTPNRLIFSNPASRSSRSRMTVRMSSDGGMSWRHSRLLYRGSSGYSCLGIVRGHIGIVFERDDYSRLTFTRFPPAWLTKPPPATP